MSLLIVFYLSRSNLTTPSKRDLIRVIVEIIEELREGEDDAEGTEDPQILLGSLLHAFPFLPRKKKRLTGISFS